MVVNAPSPCADHSGEEEGRERASSLGITSVGSYLFQRILSDGRDARFDDIRHSPPKFALAFLGQAVWVSLCLMPVLALNAVPKVAFAAVPRLLPTDLLGLGLWLAGFALEVAADRQKARWLREKREKLHDEPFMTRGLFSKR